MVDIPTPECTATYLICLIQVTNNLRSLARQRFVYVFHATPCIMDHPMYSSVTQDESSIARNFIPGNSEASHIVQLPTSLRHAETLM